ncbi:MULTISPECIES: hypothetical protein [Methylobacterium]|jgi:hypothetical protein|uniref:Uncharacterized protein n=1 Tax=Methylobacterium longum TaxID=767694 RepID=A0ABT8AIF3_9HYPH|nr:MULTISPECIES: hypothetical protein [Methylobacterium]MCJ2100486.1 hypothetical protein [Methylobacterium sp. E-046]MDN3569440.1 hypothetical protein [Methylobacterium longum]GJE10658.1 hypothetical protein FOHLNKBM_1695 [Methylobacterium longum]
MSDFSDLVAKAIQPSMTREEREAVYSVVRQAVLRLQEREALPPEDPRVTLQRHLVEETIRDIEGDVARFQSLRKLEEAFAAQNADAKAAQGRKR